MKKALFVAAEAVPFVKTGGLADVVGSLPSELKSQGYDVRVILPKYSDIPPAFTGQMTSLGHLHVPLSWRRQYGGIDTLEHEGVTYYFVDNEYYFRRKGLYGFYDDAERFAFFARAVLECLPLLDFWPDLLHCHDWHAAMVPVFLKAHYSHKPEYSRIKTIFTIHNLKYQGIFPPVILGELLDLGSEYFTFDKLEFYGKVNYLKGGLVYSDYLTTVSRTYAEEIQGPELGEKLEGLLWARRHQLTGIVNGIDYHSYNPATDKALDMNFSVQNMEGKELNKQFLQERLGLPVRPDVPMLAMVTRLVEAKGLDLVAQILDELLSLDVQLVVLGTGDDVYQSMFKIAAHRYPKKVSTHLYFDETLARRIYAASDLFIMPSRYEACGLSQLIALRYGSLPVVRETGGLQDTITSYNEVTGAGNGFSFKPYQGHDLLYTIQRALRFYQERHIWPKLVKQAMSCDYSWHQSAKQYGQIYEQLL